MNIIKLYKFVSNNYYEGTLMLWFLIGGLLSNLVGSILLGITIIKSKSKIGLIAEGRSRVITENSLRKDRIIGIIGLVLLILGFLSQFIFVILENY